MDSRQGDAAAWTVEALGRGLPHGMGISTLLRVFNPNSAGSFRDQQRMFQNIPALYHSLVVPDKKNNF